MASGLSVSVTLTLSLLLSILAITTATDYVQDTCKTTRYPDLCIKTLTPHAGEIKTDQVKLARVALSVATTKAKETKASLGNVKGKDPSLKDCVEEFDSSLQQVEDSYAELDKLSLPGKFDWHKSNAQTWLSASMSSLDDCKEITAVKDPVIEVEQLISIALTFVNGMNQNQTEL